MIEEYLKLAQESFEKKEYLKAVSYIDICGALNKTDEIKNLKEQYAKAYLEIVSKRTFEKNKVAVYAITKNEIKFVDKGYNSMKEADYICVLDTGSTDGTYEKLQELSKIDNRVIVAQQVFSPGRFDLPRNIAMTLVPEDANIFLSTDLDEVLEPGGYVALTESGNNEIHERASYQYAWSHNPSGAPGRVFWYNKVHNAKGIWRFPVHELLYSLETGKETYDITAVVGIQNMFLHHWPDTTKSRGNYLPLLEQRATEDTSDTYGLIYLSHEYFYRGFYQKSIETLNKVLATGELNQELIMESSCYLFMGDDYRELGQIDNAIESYIKAIKIDPLYREPYLNLAEVLINRQQYTEAIDIIKQALTKTIRRYVWVERDISGTYQPYDLLCLAYYYSGDKVRALGCAYKAAQIEPTIDRLQKNITLVSDNIKLSEW